jgi:predicted aldo/keto reductase-like oxidoreductase
VKCPAKIPISYILQLERYATAYFAHDFAHSEYKKLKPNASNCEHCGKCEVACPFGLPVQHMLERAHHELKKGVVKTVLVKVKETGKKYLVKFVRS